MASKLISGIFVLLAGGIIMLGIGVCGGIFLGKRLSSQNTVQINSYDQCVTANDSYLQESNPPTCVTANGLRFKGSVSSPTYTPDLTANWKTYNFSPTILFKLSQDIKDPLYVNVGHYAQETLLPNSTTIQIWGADGASPTGGKDNYDEVRKNITSNKIFQNKATKLNNNETVEFTTRTPSSEMVWGGEVYQRLRGVLIKTNDGRGLAIIHYTSQAILINEAFEKDDLIFDQILSTFRFVEQATPRPTCKPRPACLDATPRCMIAETSDMCPPNQKL